MLPNSTVPSSHYVCVCVSILFVNASGYTFVQVLLLCKRHKTDDGEEWKNVRLNALKTVEMCVLMNKHDCIYYMFVPGWMDTRTQLPRALRIVRLFGNVYIIHSLRALNIPELHFTNAAGGTGLVIIIALHHHHQRGRQPHVKQHRAMCRPDQRPATSADRPSDRQTQTDRQTTNRTASIKRARIIPPPKEINIRRRRCRRAVAAQTHSPDASRAGWQCN